MGAKKLGLAMALVAGLGTSGAVEANFSTVTQIDPTSWQVTYDVSLPWTLNGNNAVTDIIIFEEGSDAQVRAAYEYSLPVGGAASLSHTVNFEPKRALVIGMDLATSDPTSKNHVIMFLDNAFAQAAYGKLFRTSFALDPSGPYGEGAFIAELLAAPSNSTALSNLISYVQDTDADPYTPALRPALFTLGGSFAVMESSVGVPIPAPEPATLALLGLGLAGLGFSRRPIR